MRQALKGVVCYVVLWLVDTPLRDERLFMLVHCWVSGAALGCSCWALMSAGHVVVVGCVWGLCCVRTV